MSAEPYKTCPILTTASGTVASGNCESKQRTVCEVPVGKCTVDDEVAYNGNCYKVVASGMSVDKSSFVEVISSQVGSDAADASCMANNWGHLTSIANEAENHLLGIEFPCD